MNAGNAMATAPNAPATMANHNKLNQDYPDSSARSSQKSLTEKLAEQVARLLFYLQNPLLSNSERRRGWQLFERTLYQYLAVKNFGGLAWVQ